MNTILDSDIICYRCAAASENEYEDVALHRVNDLVSRILHDTGATEYEAYLSGGDSYRKKLDASYKANRTQERPRHLEFLREHFVTQWKAQVTDVIEADDAIGISATKYAEQDLPFTVASLDKDFFQIAGKHHQWEITGTFNRYDQERNLISSKPWTKVRQDFYISPLDAIKHFYKQMLIGDKADNVVGVDGIGEVKASKAIDWLHTEEEMFQKVWDLYHDKERFLTNAQLLWILKKSDHPKEVLYHFHSLQLPEEAAKLLSSHISLETQDPGLVLMHQKTMTPESPNGCL